MKPKILFATTDYSFFTKPVTQALNQLGFKVKLFDYYKPNFLVRLVGTAKLNQNLVNKLINQALIRSAVKFKPNFLLVIKGQNIFPATVNQLRQLGIITINWYPDWFDSFTWIKHNAPAYTYFINTCWETHRRLTRAGIKNYYLPFASPPVPVGPSPPKVYPVTFIGQYTSHRTRYFQAIQDLGLKVWGDRWNQRHLPYVADNRIPVNLAHRIIRQSQIVVNPLIGTAHHHPNHANVRTFEVTGLGSFLLTQPTPILSRYFRPGQELITFTTPAKLRRQVIYYLSHPHQRQQIAEAGFRRARRDHQFDVRLKQLFKLVRL